MSIITRFRFILGAALALSLSSAPVSAAADQSGEPDLNAVNAQTKRVADAYFAAYIARDWDRLEPLVADNADFQDPTATFAFGAVVRTGKAEMMESFRKGYAAITKMEFRPLRQLQFGQDSIYEGELDWAIKLSGGRLVQSVMPLVTILHVENDKVVHHRDYADYRPFLAANDASRAAAKGK